MTRKVISDCLSVLTRLALLYVVIAYDVVGFLACNPLSIESRKALLIAILAFCLVLIVVKMPLRFARHVPTATASKIDPADVNMMNFAQHDDIQLSVLKAYGPAVAAIALTQSENTDSKDAVLTRAKKISDSLERSQSTLSTPIKLARHEASHAVVMDALGDTVTSAHIDPSAHKGHVESYAPFDVSTPNRLWSSVVSGIAGNVTDLDSNWVHSGSAVDFAQLTSDVFGILSTGTRPDGYLGEMTSDELINGARSLAREILESRSERFDALTYALVEQNNLTGREVRKIFERTEVHEHG